VGVDSLEVIVIEAFAPGLRVRPKNYDFQSSDYMGRNHTPSAILDAKGSYIHNPQLKRPNEPVASRPLGGPPKWLSPEEKVVWRDVAKQVLPGVAFNSDRNTFELLVRLITKMRAGQMDKSSDMCQMVSLSARFGMTPSDRAKISVEAPKESALTKFLAGHTPSAPKVQ